MRYKDTITDNLLQFVLAFVITFIIVISCAFYINTLWELYTTDLGLSYNIDTIPTQKQWDIFFKYIALDLIISGITAFIVGVFIAALFNDSDF